MLDANFIYKNILLEGLSFGVNVSNILDAEYFHPGLRQANSGTEPGNWDGKAWSGSKGWYNSQLPQPKRWITFSLKLDL